MNKLVKTKIDEKINKIRKKRKRRKDSLQNVVHIRVLWFQKINCDFLQQFEQK